MNDEYTPDINKELKCIIKNNSSIKTISFLLLMKS